MPLITRLFLKSGLIFFLVSLLIGITSHVSAMYFPAIIPLFWHTLTLGWITQIIMGVSMWMFPGRVKEESFQNQRFGWIAFGGLNLGLLLRVTAEPLLYLSPEGIWDAVLIISAILQFIGVISYVLEIWPRVISQKKRREKKTKGEIKCL